MPSIAENVAIAAESIRTHKLRAALTVLGLTMGVATLITVMTIVQGANLYVEQKVANLGTDVFQIAKTPFAVVDFTAVTKALRNKNITIEQVNAVAASCRLCQRVGASVSTTINTHYRSKELQDTSLQGQTASMVDIDTRTVTAGRYFNDSEETHGADVCVIGDKLAAEFFAGVNPIGKSIRMLNTEFTVIGIFEKIGSVLGQDRDNFAVIPLSTYLRMRGSRQSLTLQIKAAGGKKIFEEAQDEARLTLRARRHVRIGEPDDFFIGTASSYISLWESISSAFFAVFVMVSSISAVVGGIVIMNVMLVSVTERTKEVGVRRAVGATQEDILKQFLTESVLQCLVGGFVGIAAGFGCALALRTFTAFPASVQLWVAALGVVLSSLIGVFFGIYPAVRAARLDPVVALRAE
ncbi:MAG TPA: ABC transporter permease [Bryobacteraceae bacterium]|jgi:putative ABC transport system permease protein|nr:ABC transporter permease [Bryobacteraceae bacterium]